MSPKSHKDAAVKPDAAETPQVPGSQPDSTTSLPLAEQLLYLIRILPSKVIDGVAAGLAFSANQALATQIQLVHGVGQYVRGCSVRLAYAGEMAPAGPVREVFGVVARTQASVAEALSESALQCGRNCGQLAFAFPLPGWRY